MSDHPTPDEDRAALAGEYVLGTLDARQAAAVARAMAADPALAAEVAAWEARLAPLQGIAVAEAPPPGLWDRISASLDAVRPAPAAQPRRDWFWKGWSFGASAVAAGLGLLLLMRPPAPSDRWMTVLLSSREQPAWLVEADRDGLRLAALNRQPAPEDRALQLWALPPGATAPVSLGLIPRDGGSIAVSATMVRPQPGMLIEITLEPPGGSPTGRPTGPVQFIGRLAPATGT
ncbi:MAG TPA: anti-sigma factor [Roseomonas sp.]|jgi:anti-sigma-K factor RskA